MRNNPFNLRNRWIIKAFDFITSGIGLIMLAHLFGVVAFLVKATSRGPVFYRQDRVGFQHKLFRVYKFRTMVDRADAIGKSVTAGNDPRITPIGR
ncbi:MAG: sugar transferase, partial [Pseudomonadota bacterium]